MQILAERRTAGCNPLTAVELWQDTAWHLLRMSKVPQGPDGIPGEIDVHFAHCTLILTQVEEVAFGCLDSTEMTIALRLHHTPRAKRV